MRIGRTVTTLVGVIGLVTTWFVLGALGPARADDLVAAGDDPVGSAQLLALANADRSAAGLPALTPRDDVYAIGVEHSRRMAEAYDIFHNDDYFSSAVRSALAAKSLGENVAMNKDVSDAHRRLMLSPGHRANLMDPRFTVVGIGVVRTADGMAFITEDFVEPSSAARPLPVATPAPTPAPAPAPAPATPPPTTTHPPAPAPTTTAPAAVTTTTAAPAPSPTDAPPGAAGPSTADAAVAPAPAPVVPTDGNPAELAAGRLAHADTSAHAVPLGRGGLVVAAAVAIGLLVAVALLASRLARRPQP